MEETKTLTPVQQAHLLKLLQVRDAAQANLDAFIDYLTAEHGISTKDGWTLNAKDGFVRREPSNGV